jgi:hypothetical protein
MASLFCLAKCVLSTCQHVKKYEMDWKAFSQKHVNVSENQFTMKTVLSLLFASKYAIELT